MLRAWHAEYGLLVEVPAVVAANTVTGEPVAWFEEAAALEGKTPEGVECIRPWWADAITDRAALRSLAARFRELLAEALYARGEKAPAVSKILAQASWRVPPTTTELHRQWLERTLTEAGWWWPKVQRASYSVLFEPERVQSSSSHSSNVAAKKTSAQTLVLDWGASALRWSVWVEGHLVFAQSHPELGWAEVAAELVSAEQAITQRVFSRASLLDLHWSVRHPAFDRKHHEPVFEPLSKTTLQSVHASWLEAYIQSWKQFQEQLPKESAAQLAVSASVVIGGGAALKDWIESAAQETHVEWQAAKDPVFIEVRGGAF